VALNFTGHFVFDHISITCIINLKPQTLQPHAYMNEYLSKKCMAYERNKHFQI